MWKRILEERMFGRRHPPRVFVPGGRVVFRRDGSRVIASIAYRWGLSVDVAAFPVVDGAARIDLSVLRERVAMAIQKPKGGPSGPGGLSANVMKADRAKLPLLAEYMTLEAYDDGSPRETSSVTIFVKDGSVKAVLNDRQEGRSLWGEGATVMEALVALDVALASPVPPWRWDRRASGGPKNSRK